SRDLDGTLADPIVEVAIKQTQGVIRDLDGDAAREAAKANVAIREEFERSKAEAVISMIEFIEALHEEHKTSMDFALGRDRFQKLLWVNDRISQPVEEVLELAIRDLEANTKALSEVTERIRPGAKVSTILEEIQQDHPTAKLLIDDAAEGLHDLEGWLRERELGTSMTRKAYWNYAFGEGWAHYCEEMMLDEGYGVERLRFIQLKEALLRDCRFIVSFKMHTQGMTLDEARQFIMKNAWMEAG